MKTMKLEEKTGNPDLQAWCQVGRSPQSEAKANAQRNHKCCKKGMNERQPGEVRPPHSKAPADPANPHPHPMGAPGKANLDIHITHSPTGQGNKAYTEPCPSKERQCKLGESEEQARAPWAFKVLTLKSCLKEPAGQVVQHADVSTDECTLELSQVSAAVEEMQVLGRLATAVVILMMKPVQLQQQGNNTTQCQQQGLQQLLDQYTCIYPGS
jgi:hypothetical protein